MQTDIYAAAEADIEALFNEIDTNSRAGAEAPTPPAQGPPQTHTQNGSAPAADEGHLPKHGANTGKDAIDEVVEEISKPLLDLQTKRRTLNVPLDVAERELFGRIARTLYGDDESLYHSNDPQKGASLNRISNRLWQAGLDYKPHTVRRRILAYFVEKWFGARAVAPVQQLRNSALLELERVRKYPEAAVELATIAAEKGLSKRRVHDMVNARLQQLEAGVEHPDPRVEHETHAEDQAPTGAGADQDPPEPPPTGENAQQGEQQSLACSGPVDGPEPATAASDPPDATPDQTKDTADERIISLVMPVVELFEERFRNESTANYECGIEALAAQLRKLGAARGRK